MKKILFLLILVASFSVLLGSNQDALAGGSSLFADGSGPPQDAEILFCAGNNCLIFPARSVEYQEGAGPWVKEFHRLGGPFPEKAVILEDLVVGGSTPWTDWHEEILTPDVTWDFVRFDELPPGQNPTVEGIDTATLEIFFNPPLQPGEEISLVKRTSDIAGLREFSVQQYPTVHTSIVAGETIPIEHTSLLLAGAQSFSWMIPVTLSVLGIGLFVVTRKSENS